MEQCDWYPYFASSRRVSHAGGLAVLIEWQLASRLLLPKSLQFGRRSRRAGHNDLAHAMQDETSVQTVYEAGALVSRCRWFCLPAASSLDRLQSKIFRGRLAAACRLPGVKHYACILGSERTHTCLFISVFRDIGRVQAAVVITIGQDVRAFRGASTCATLQLTGGQRQSMRLYVVQV